MINRFKVPCTHFKLHFVIDFFICFLDETHTVEAVLGKTTNLPCDIESRDRQNVVYMVLWFRKNDDKPIYRYISSLNFICTFTIVLTHQNYQNIIITKTKNL